MSDDEPGSVAVLNLWAVTGLVVAGLVGIGGVFSLPVLESYGVDTVTAFWVAFALEGVAAGIAVVSILFLHTERA